MNGHLHLAYPSSVLGVPRFGLAVFDVVFSYKADRMGGVVSDTGEGQCRWCMINRVASFA
jgi:hypothetical protein